MGGGAERSESEGSIRHLPVSPRIAARLTSATDLGAPSSEVELRSGAALLPVRIAQTAATSSKRRGTSSSISQACPSSTPRANRRTWVGRRRMCLGAHAHKKAPPPERSGGVRRNWKVPARLWLWSPPQCKTGRRSSSALKIALINSQSHSKPVAAVDLSPITPAWHAGGQEFESPWLHFPKAQACPGLFCAQHP